MKKYIAIVALMLGVFLSGCRSFLDDSVPRDEIFSYVNANYEKLENFPYEKIQNFNDLNTGYENYEARDKNEANIIKEHLGNKSIVKSVYAYNENILEFYCGGSGLVTGSTYTGFYYSKDDTPYGMEFDGYGLTEIEAGVFEWQNEDGSHKIHTEKIRDNWYYYIQDYY